jgi:hypothetical protein
MQGMRGQVERRAREDSKETGGNLPAQHLEFNLYPRSSPSRVSVHTSSNLSMLVVTHEYALCIIRADPPLFISESDTEWRYCELNPGICNLCCFPTKIAIDSSYLRLIRLLIFNWTLVAHWYWDFVLSSRVLSLDKEMLMQMISSRFSYLT